MDWGSAAFLEEVRRLQTKYGISVHIKDLDGDVVDSFGGEGGARASEDVARADAPVDQIRYVRAPFDLDSVCKA
eukprot:6950171-Pyramimonas_sp.AAC.1